MSVCGGEFNSEQMASVFSQCKEKSRFRRNIEEQEREETVFVLGSVEVGDNLFTSVQPDYLEFLQQYSGLWLE